MRENGWLTENDTGRGSQIFEFAKKYDYGFTRYPFPGEAHNDYWKDDRVFGHFIDNVVRGESNVREPTTIAWIVLISWILPYVICLALLTAGVYILYNTLVSVFFPKNHPHILMDVAGVTPPLPGSSLPSRLPRPCKNITRYLFCVAALIGGRPGGCAL